MNPVFLAPDYQALLAACRAAPEDDTSRLVMADWLDEQGEVNFAELVRLQCEINRLDMDADGSRQLPMGVGREALIAREHAILHDNWPGSVMNNETAWLIEFINIVMRDGRPNDYRTFSWQWRRGMIHSLRVEMADWMRYGPQLVRYPLACLRDVVLIDRKPGDYYPDADFGDSGEHQGYYWSGNQFEGGVMAGVDYFSVNAHMMPNDLYYLIDSGKVVKPYTPTGYMEVRGQERRVFPTEIAAHDALSAAAVKWAWSQQPVGTAGA